MIKHETTIEESKQIKELRYDFSPVCKDFYIDWIESAGSVGETYEEDIYDCSGILRKERDYFIGLCFEIPTKPIFTKLHEDDEAIEDITPIIPYTILEACLPLIAQKAYTSDGEEFTELCYWLKRAGSDSYWNHAARNVNKLEEELPLFEAFTWCHKHYPKETRAKFKEVIK